MYAKAVYCIVTITGYLYFLVIAYGLLTKKHTIMSEDILTKKFLSRYKNKTSVLSSISHQNSIPHLKSLLACYDSDEMVAIGERYGYMAVKRHGYDYITGGGGMVFSRALVRGIRIKELFEDNLF